MVFLPALSSTHPAVSNKFSPLECRLKWFTIRKSRASESSVAIIGGGFQDPYNIWLRITCQPGPKEMKSPFLDTNFFRFDCEAQPRQQRLRLVDVGKG